MGFFKNHERAAASSPAPSSSASSGLSNFAFRLYENLADKEAGKNIFVSPFSIQVALAMCAAGARGETRKVLADLIGAPDDVEEQNRQYASLLQEVAGEGERHYQFLTANALWVQQGYRLKPDYQMTIANCYGGALNELDFSSRPDEAVVTINSWVSDKTCARITALVNREVIEGALLVLTNAIYFKGNWAHEFSKDRTTDEDWYGPSGTTQSPTMHRTGEYSYYEDGQCQALDLSYQGGALAMLIVLPRQKDGLAALERQLTAPGAYGQVTDRLRIEETVIVSLPRFKIEAQYALKPILCLLGAELAFSAAADFGDISEGPLMISKVSHKAFVEVNEEGTEAAAATAVVMIRAMAAMTPKLPEPKRFKADHPFWFCIRDRRSNDVLFAGRVLDPK